MATAKSHPGPERRLATPSPFLIGLAALALAAIAFATLCPIGLRPHLASANAERFAAFLVLGALVGLAAGRRALAATAVVVLLAFALEAAQRLAPGRDAALSDAMIKALGGVLGAAAAQLAHPLRRLFAGGLTQRPRLAAALRGRRGAIVGS